MGSPSHICRQFVCGLVVIPFALCAAAQQARLQVSDGPHYIEVPVSIQVVVDGFAQEPEPRVEVADPEDATLKLVRVNPNVSTSIQIINGKMSRSKTVRFVYQYRLQARAKKRIRVGPFRFTQGGTSAQTGTVNLDFGNLPSSDDLQLRLILPEQPIWVGQRVKIDLEWWLTAEFAERVGRRVARVPLFDLVDWFRFEPTEETGTQVRNTLNIETNSGTLELPISVRREVLDKEPYVVVRGSRLMTALKAGKVTVPPAVLAAEETIRWRRDFFGQQVPADVRQVRIKDDSREVEIKAPPVAGRPTSFAGAVGSGFTIDVQADRSVVQAGDPIRLRIAIRGDGALDTLSLPALAKSGLAPTDFKTPGSATTGLVENGTKRFEIDVRVMHEGVREIPPLTFSWFSPQSGSYDTTRSRPIALSVRAARVVSATDVVRQPSPNAAADPGEAAALPSSKPKSEDLAEAPSAIDLTGAELSIVTDRERLAVREMPWYTNAFAQGVAYALGVVCLLSGWWQGRRGREDPRLRASRRKLNTIRRTVRAASGARDLATVLRQLATVCRDFDRREYEAILDHCDNLIYAPGASVNPPIDSTLQSRAIAVAETAVPGSSDD